MPFRAGNGTKEMFMFQSYAKTREKHHHKKRRGSKLVEMDTDHIPIWVPGFVLFALPGQPEWMCDLDAAFWSNLLYVAGSVIYVAQGLYFWHNLKLTDYDDYNANNPSNYLNLVGAALFVANALVALVDWYLCAQQASVMNVSLDHIGDEQTDGKFLVQDMGNRILNLYFWNNIFFLFAAITWLIGGIWLYDQNLDVDQCIANNDNTKCFSFWIPFVATGNYLLSSLCGLWEYFETTRFRKAQNLPPLPMFTLDFYKLDWFGWGDWLYFLASALPFCQSFMTGFYPWPEYADDHATTEAQNSVVAPLYNTSNIIFLVDSIAYMVGYVLFVYEIIGVMRKRHDEEELERLKHGHVDHLHTSRESFSRNYEGDGDESSSHYVKNAITKMVLRRESTIVPTQSPSGVRRGSGHGSAIMNMGQRTSFSNGEQSGFQLSPLVSPRSSFGSTSPGMQPAGPYPGSTRLSGSWGSDGPMPPPLSAVNRAPSAAYR